MNISEAQAFEQMRRDIVILKTMAQEADQDITGLAEAVNNLCSAIERIQDLMEEEISKPKRGRPKSGH